MIKKFLLNYFLLIALFLGLVIRLISINQSLWLDESISAMVTKSFSFSGIVTEFIRSDTHPPLYYLILKAWTLVFGFSEISLRMPSIIFGILTIIVIFKLGKLINDKVALYASFLSAFSPLLVYYSQEARMYSLSTFLVSLTVYLFLTKRWFGYSLTLLMLGMTDYLPLTILLPLVIYAAGKNILEQNYPKIKFLFSHVPLFVFLLFWFPVLSFQSNSTVNYLNNNSWWAGVLGQSNFKNLALVWVKFIIGRINFSPNYLYALIVLAVSGLIIFVLIKSLKYWKETIIYWLWLIIPITVSFLVSFGLPGFSYFRLIFTLPAFILLISFGISKHKLGILLFTIFFSLQIIFSLIYLLNSSYWREDWKSAVKFIEGRLKDDEKIYVAYKQSFTPYTWYASRPQSVESFDSDRVRFGESFYSLDYLMDLTDPERSYYKDIEDLGYKNSEVYNFRGVGQVRYWTK